MEEDDAHSFDQKLHDSFKVWYTAEKARTLLVKKLGNDTDILVWCGNNLSYVFPKCMSPWPTIQVYHNNRYYDAPLHYARDQHRGNRAIDNVAEYICSCTVKHRPLFIASNRDGPEIIKLLLYHGNSATDSPYNYTSFHELAWNAKTEGAKALLYSPQGSPGCSATIQKEASNRILTTLCCFKKLHKLLSLPCPLPKDVAYYILSFLPDDLYKSPLGAYWKRYNTQQLIEKASFDLQLLLTTTHKIGMTTVGPIFKKEKTIEALTSRHTQNLQTTLKTTSTYFSPSNALTASQLVKYRYRDCYFTEEFDKLLDYNKIESLLPNIKAEYTKLFNGYKAQNE